jgi:hypothetical protein
VGARINSAGGGVKPQELVAAATLRELRDELGEELGEGELRVRDDFPLLVGYQRRSNNGVGEAAYLMAVVIAEYQATGREVETLTERGMWVSFDHLLEMSKKREANGMFRPAFRTALWLTGMSRGMAVDRWDHLVGSINTAVIGTSLYDAEQRGIEVNPGLFAQAVQYYLLADWQS